MPALWYRGFRVDAEVADQVDTLTCRAGSPWLGSSRGVVVPR